MDKRWSALKNAIKQDNSECALVILNQNNQFLNESGLSQFTPLGYAATKNKIKCVEAISSLPGVDFSRGYKMSNTVWLSPLYYALYCNHEQAAQILARKGGDVCTALERQRLGERYTYFKAKQVHYPVPAVPEEIEEIMRVEDNKRSRRAIADWMKQNGFQQLKKWLGESKNQLEALFVEGEVPVKGWLELAEKIKCKDQYKRNLEAELDKNAREKQQIEQQMKNLQEKQEELEKKTKKLLEEMKKMDEIGVLESETNTIAMLGNKEEESLAKVDEKMKNPYFMDELDFGDVSTLFSMFEMDSLFARFKENCNDVQAALLTPIAELEKNLKLEFSEAMEMLFKLNLLENGEKEAKRHLSKCSICKTSDLATLLREYGMKDEEKKDIGEKIKEWKGYFLVATQPGGAAATLDISTSLRSKFTVCLGKIQKAHNWNQQD